MTPETRPASQRSKRAKTGSRTGTTKKAASSAKAKPASKTTKKKTAKSKVTKKKVAKKVARKTTPRKKTATRKKAASKRATSSKAAPAVVESTRRSVSADERRRMIAEAAYYRAERLGGRVDPTRNWLEAEAEIDAVLMGTKRAD